MHRFFLIDQPLQVGHEVDLADIHRQLHNVLRLQVGDTIFLLDGEGYGYETEIVALTRKRGCGRPLNKMSVNTEPLTQLTLYQCSLKSDKFEWVLQKGTELGVHTFVPVISERSIVRPASALQKKYPRWRKIIQEAAEQSGRGRIPSLANPLPFQDALPHDDALKIVPWEEVDSSDDGATLEMLLSSAQRRAAVKSLSLLIGPEGGLTEAEAKDAQSHGWRSATLGPRILRAETAAIATAAIIINRLG